MLFFIFQNNNTFTRFYFDGKTTDQVGSQDVKAMLEDEDGRVWFGTANGLYYLSEENNSNYTFKRIDKKNNRLLSEAHIKNILKDKEGNLYSIDFNLRPFGGFDKGSYDTDVSDQNWSSYLFGNVPPDYITYTDTVRCVYKKKQRFGYSDIDRIKIKLTYLKFEVKTYD